MPTISEPLTEPRSWTYFRTRALREKSAWCGASGYFSKC